MTDELSQIGLHYGTDKARDHGYTAHYHRRFAYLRHEPVRLLEIGIGGYEDPLAGGQSLRMWRDYFTDRRAVIVGMDVHVKAPIEGCEVVQGDQSNPADLRSVGSDYGPFDIIVDDGSHKPDDVMQSWVVLWDFLKSPGWYCIEDLQTSYWAGFGGSSARTGETVIGFLQGLIDRIHYAEFDVPGYNPNRFDLSVTGLEIARNIAFIRKGDNSRPSSYMPVHPHGKVWDEEAPPVPTYNS